MDDEEDDEGQVQSRGKFNYRPMGKRPEGYYPLSATLKQSWFNLITNNMNMKYQSCVDPNGFNGICSPSFLCSGLNGRPSGSCPSPFASVCCISK